MIAYGYEQPVAITPTEIFNPTTANMVLQSIGQYANALREDYKDTIAKQDEFLKEYGSFISPIEADTQNYYDMTTGGLNRLINDAQDRGIDLFRSSEGRALIQRYISSRPYGQLAKIRQSAETARQYKSAAAKLKAEGKFNPELEAIMGAGDLSKWDTLKNGIWETESPTVMKNLYELTHDRFDPLAHQNFDLGPGRDKYHRNKGVDEAHMEPIAETALDGIKNSPYYQYYKKVYGSDDAIKKAMINANKGVLHNSEQTDDVQLKFADWDHDIKMENIRHNNRMKEEAEKGGNKTNGGLPQLTAIIDMATQNSKSNINSQAFVNYFTNLARNTKDAKIKTKYQGYAKEWKDFMTADSSKKEAFLKKYGYMDKNGLTAKFYQWQDKATGASRGNTTQRHNTTVRNSDEYYQSYMNSIVDGPAKNTLVRAMGGTKQKNGLYSVQFGAGTTYSGHRALAFSGGYGSNRRAMIEKEFDRWLRNSKVTGNLWDHSNMVAGKLPGNVLEIAGVTTTVKASKIKEFLDYIKKRHVSTSKGYTDNGRITNEEILSCLGLSVMEADGKPTKWSTDAKGKTRTSGEYETIFVGIPTSRSIDANGTNLYGLNSDFNRELFGGGSAYKLGEDAMLESMMFQQ